MLLFSKKWKPMDEDTANKSQRKNNVACLPRN